jgi:hypothetical protein
MLRYPVHALLQNVIDMTQQKRIIFTTSERAGTHP